MSKWKAGVSRRRCRAHLSPWLSSSPSPARGTLFHLWGTHGCCPPVPGPLLTQPGLEEAVEEFVLGSNEGCKRGERGTSSGEGWHGGVAPGPMGACKGLGIPKERGSPPLVHPQGGCSHHRMGIWAQPGQQAGHGDNFEWGPLGTSWWPPRVPGHSWVTESAMGDTFGWLWGPSRTGWWPPGDGTAGPPAGNTSGWPWGPSGTGR